MKSPRVTVFGGSRNSPGDRDYTQALELGHRLGEMGCTVLTGGYIGSMEAVSRGAAESGGHVIGVTCQEIENWRPVSPNRWVQEEMRFSTLRERLFALIDECTAAVALPGGPGTLTEVAVLWNHLLTDAVEARPLILVGEGWKTTFNQFFQSHDRYIPLEQRKWLQFSPDVAGTIDLLREEFELS